MTLLRSAPRQAYRIYSEEEFLAAEDWQASVGAGSGAEFEPAYEFEPEFALLGQAGPQRAGTRWGRVVAVAALTAAVTALVAVVAVNERRSTATGRRFASRRIAPALPREDRSPTSSTGGEESDGAVHRYLLRASTAMRHVAPRHAQARPLPVAHRSVRVRSHRTAMPAPATAATTMAAATVAEPTTVATAATPTAATASSPVAATTGTAATSAAGGAGAEFGFERR